MIENKDTSFTPAEVENLVKMQEFLLRSFSQSTAYVGDKNVTKSVYSCYAAILAATAAQGYATITDLLRKNRDNGPS